VADFFADNGKAKLHYAIQLANQIALRYPASEPARELVCDLPASC